MAACSDGEGATYDADAGAAGDAEVQSTPDVSDAAPGSARDVVDAGADAARGDGGSGNPARTATQVVTAEQASARVMVFDFNAQDWSNDKAVVWTWSPPNPTTTFSNLSDVKYTKDGKRLLVAASGGGIAGVDVATKKIVFRAEPGGNTHAVEELPDGSMVSASSLGGFLKLYTKNAALVQTISFTDAHGVYWDDKRKLLYADGANVLEAFTYAGGTLKRVGSWTLPSGGAHDLFPVPGSNELFVSNGGNVLQFDRDTHVFGAYTFGPNRSGIKAVSQNPGSQVVGLLKATNAPGPAPRSWSSDTVIFDQPGGTTVTRKRAGAQFYKARWVAPTP